MKRFRNVLGSMILLLVGFSAGVGLRVFPLVGSVQGVPGPEPQPPAALKAVTHDATLSGAGTDASPLAVANAGITAPKLKTPAPPQAGQVLGYNGSSLAWGSGADDVGTSLWIQDNLSRRIGPLMFLFPSQDAAAVAVKIGGRTAVLEVTSEGFVQHSFLAFLHDTVDCSGQRFLSRSSAARTGFIMDVSFVGYGQIHYPTGPYQQRVVRSIEVIEGPNGDLTKPGRCDHPSYVPYQENVAPAQSVALSTLGFIPPFRLN